MILSSLSCIPGRMVWAAEQTQGRIAAASISGKSTAAPQTLPADQNDPGYERLTGQYEPAAEENISGAGSAVSTFSADAQGSGGFLSVNPATSGLKGYSSSL